MADKKISDLTVATAAVAAMELEVNDAGTSKRLTVQKARDLTATDNLTVAKGGTGSSTASAARTALGLVIGTDVLANLVEDTTPQLGGALDTNAKAIDESEATAVASAATTDIWATDGNTIHVTGTTTITSFGTAPRVGAWRKVIFDGVLTLTDGANLNLPGAANITTAADDFAFVYAETTTLFKVLYFREDGTAVVSSGATFTGFSGLEIIRKTADETVNNSTTLQDDDHLFAALAANERVFFHLALRHNSSTTADIKFKLTIPSGAVAKWNSYIGVRHDVNDSVALRFEQSGTVVYTIGGGSADETIDMWGSVLNGGTPGNLQLQWAQNTANASDTKVLTDSILQLWRI